MATLEELSPESREYVRRLEAVENAYRDDPEEMGRQIIEEMLRINREKPFDERTHDRLRWYTEWQIDKYQDAAALARGECEVCPFDGNLALNEGITEVMLLIIGGAATAYSAANTYLGVGADTTAADATQTGLIAASNKYYQLVDSVSTSGQTITWQATFGSGVANFAWEEFTVANGGDNTADNLNRKVSGQGTKASPNIWILQVKITLG